MAVEIRGDYKKFEKGKYHTHLQKDKKGGAEQPDSFTSVTEKIMKWTLLGNISGLMKETKVIAIVSVV